MAKKKVKRKLSRPTLPMQRHLNLQHEGRYFDLRRIFERVNERHFRGRLRGYRVVWGRRRKERPREYFIFGSIQEEDRVIRIHPLLDQPFVPRWFLEYVLYHEMLHSVVRDETDAAGRRRIHTEEFYRREKAFPSLPARPEMGGRKSRALPALIAQNLCIPIRRSAARGISYSRITRISRMELGRERTRNCIPPIRRNRESVVRSVAALRRLRMTRRARRAAQTLP